MPGRDKGYQENEAEQGASDFICVYGVGGHLLLLTCDGLGRPLR